MITGFTPQINHSDVMFAVHGTFISSTMGLLMLCFPPRVLPRTFITIICVSILVVVFAGLGLCAFEYFDWYAYLRFISMVKVLATMFKLIPQIILNRSRQSTICWSFYSICLVTVGDTFSLAQQIVCCFRVKSLAPFTSNFAKTFLAGESLMFDVFFISQHMQFHPSKDETLLEETPKGVVQADSSQVGVYTRLLPV